MYAVNIKFTNKIWSVLQKRNDDRTVLPIKISFVVPTAPTLGGFETSKLTSPGWSDQGISIGVELLIHNNPSFSFSSFLSTF